MKKSKLFKLVCTISVLLNATILLTSKTDAKIFENFTSTTNENLKTSCSTNDDYVYVKSLQSSYETNPLGFIFSKKLLLETCPALIDKYDENMFVVSVENENGNKKYTAPTFLNHYHCPYCKSETDSNDLYVLEGLPIFNELGETHDNLQKDSDKLKASVKLFNGKNCCVTLYWFNKDKNKFEEIISVGEVPINTDESIDKNIFSLFNEINHKENLEKAKKQTNQMGGNPKILHNKIKKNSKNSQTVVNDKNKYFDPLENQDENFYRKNSIYEKNYAYVKGVKSQNSEEDGQLVFIFSRNLLLKTCKKLLNKSLLKRMTNFVVCVDDGFGNKRYTERTLLKRIVCPYCSSDKYDELFILTGSPAFNTLYDTFDTYNNTFDSSKYTEKIESPFYLFNNKSCQITLYWLNPDTKSFENLFSVNHVIIDGSDKINLSGDYKILDKSDDEDGLRYELDLFVKISHPGMVNDKINYFDYSNYQNDSSDSNCFDFFNDNNFNDDNYLNYTDDTLNLW